MNNLYGGKVAMWFDEYYPLFSPPLSSPPLPSPLTFLLNYILLLSYYFLITILCSWNNQYAFGVVPVNILVRVEKLYVNYSASQKIGMFLFLSLSLFSSFPPPCSFPLPSFSLSSAFFNILSPLSFLLDL